MDLNYRQLGSLHNPHVVIAHGLFGSSSNWQSIARKLADQYCLWLVDMRNHGDSAHSDEMSYQAMARDLANFAASHCESETALIGHSMGGKAAMTACLLFPEYFSALMAMDSAPIAHRSSFQTYIAAMQGIDLNLVTDRGQADRALDNVVTDPGERGFLLQNLRQGDTGWYWRINLPVLADSLDSLSGFPELRGQFEMPVLFLRGAESNYVPDDVISRCEAQFPSARMATVAKAGHWLHAQQPGAVTAAIRAFLNAVI